MDPELVKVLPQVVTGGFTLAAGFGVAVMNQVTQTRQRDRERIAAAAAKANDVVRELLAATADLQLVLVQVAPLWNSWQPKLMMLGSAVLEFSAARAAGFEHGMAQVGRIATRHGDRELALAPGVAAAVKRVVEATTGAALLPDGAVRTAALHLADAAMDLNVAYGKDNLWRPHKARAARTVAEAALNHARADLISAVGAP
ncbi:MAG TPA: hypothetical protein VKB75_16645, partial [Jatrophihabitans sp.]|nr:hypothetical protein [Jatrophihabitans sp.]